MWSFLNSSKKSSKLNDHGFDNQTGIYKGEDSSITPPKGWDYATDYGYDANFIAPGHAAELNVNFAIEFKNIEELEEYNSAYKDKNIKKKSLQIIKEESTTVAGHPTHYLEAKYLKKGKPNYWIEWYINVGNSTYYINFGTDTDESEWPQYANLVHQSVSTFKPSTD